MKQKLATINLNGHRWKIERSESFFRLRGRSGVIVVRDLVDTDLNRIAKALDSAKEIRMDVHQLKLPL